MQIARANVGKGELSFILRKLKFSFSEIDLPPCTRRATHHIRVLQATRVLSVSTHFHVVRSAGAWQERVVCRWPTSRSEKLKLNIFSEK